MGTPNSLLEGENICLSRSGRTILSNVSLRLEEDDFVTLIGPIGAGKSMLLKALLGLEKIDSGVVRKKPNLRLGFVPETINLDPSLPMSVRRFLTLSKGRAPLQDDIVQETSIETLLDVPMTALSGGERQRVLLARALHHKPELLILDEPAQNLDMRGQLNLYALMQKIYERHKIAILMVSHDLHIVMSSTRKVVCLYEHVCCSGEPQAVARDPEFISLFGEDMARLISVYPHDHDHSHDDHDHTHHDHPHHHPESKA